MDGALLLLASEALGSLTDGTVAQSAKSRYRSTLYWLVVSFALGGTIVRPAFDGFAGT